jgi:hypothetical protein
MNAKQRGKEYKAVQKDIKSKDPESKQRAMDKFSDSRYFTEGGCFPFFIISIAPKKVRNSQLVLMTIMEQLILFFLHSLTT